MFVPSKAGKAGDGPMVTVCRIAPAESSRRSVPVPWSETQTLAPSYRAATGYEKPVVTVVTVQGSESPGTTIETDPKVSAVQNRLPSKATPTGAPPTLATMVTAPADW